MKHTSKTWNRPESCALPITLAELSALGVTLTPSNDGTAQEYRGKLATRGPWQLPVSFTALCGSTVWDESRGYTAIERETYYGVRTLSQLRQSGYQLEGRVSVNGKSVRGFTSSQLFDVSGIGLVSVATIHACL